MINNKIGHVRTVVAKVGNDPRFKDSIHDDASAAKFGFRSALVPGPTVCSYMSHLFVEAWGEQWLRHGTMTERSRRPVYEGRTVTATADPIRTDETGLSADVVLRYPDGEEAAFATGGLPRDIAAAPAMSLFAHRPHLDVTPTVTAGGHKPGDFFRSTPTVYTQQVHDDYLDKAGETLPIFHNDKVAHPGFLLGFTMREAIASYIKPTPGIHVSVVARHFDIAHVGDTISTSGQIIRVFEKKGSHYMESDQLVVANGTRPIALFRRTSIYAVRSVAA